MKRMIIFTAISAAYVFNVASCAPKKSISEAPPEPARWQPTMHWLHDEQLRTVMRELGRTAQEVPDLGQYDPDAPKLTTDVRFQFEAAAILAEKLSHSANRIPGAIEHLNVGVADRAAFLEQARALRDQARRLNLAARERDIQTMQRQLDAVTTSCVSCHTRFRDFTPELAPPRV